MNKPLLRAGFLLALLALAPDLPKDPAIGRSYRLPYRLTATNHYLVRVRINGKGPFNFLVDSGAPALFVGTEAAKAIGLEPARDDFWTAVERLDLEGGASLTHLKARVEDPFQLTGMNAIGLPGARIDGILGFTILARFKLEFDPTRDRMIWTRIDYEPKEPFIPRFLGNKAMQAPAEVQAMQALGPIMKFASVLVGKQPEEQLHPRGFLGVEVAEVEGTVQIAMVLPGSPAEISGVRAGDIMVKAGGQEIGTLTDVRAAVAALRPGKVIVIVVRRGGERRELNVTAGEGF